MKRSLYPWWMVGVGWLIYGFAISPGYYSWGFFLPEVLRDLDLTRFEGSLIWTGFTISYSCSGPLVGMAIERFGLRRVVTIGAALAAVGFFLTSRANSWAACVLGFSLLGGLGVGFSAVLPAQTLAAKWFLRQRSTALAVLMTAGGIVGLAVPLIDARILESSGWRTGWIFIAGCSAGVSVLAALFLRDDPESVGLLPDGERPSSERSDETEAASTAPIGGPTGADSDWEAGPAMRTGQFKTLVLCGMAFAVPWGVVVPHLRLHLGDRALDAALIAKIFSAMILASIVGRLLGAAGDLLPPQRVLAIGLLIEAIGVALLIFVDGGTMATAATVLIALGFGSAYVSVPAVFALYFGRRAFSTTSGTRMLIVGVVNAAMPALAGYSYDRLETYTPVFVTLAALAATGSLAALMSRSPGAPA